MTAYALNPDGHDWATWANTMTFANSLTGVLPDSGPEAEWQTWARAFVATSGVAAYLPPDPAAFTDWRQWGAYLQTAIP